MATADSTAISLLVAAVENPNHYRREDTKVFRTTCCQAKKEHADFSDLLLLSEATVEYEMEEKGEKNDSLPVVDIGARVVGVARGGGIRSLWLLCFSSCGLTRG